MNVYQRAGLLILVWSAFLAFSYNHFVQRQNPFAGSVCSLLLLIAVVVQLVALRKRGIRYISVFLVCLIVVTALLLYADSQIFSPARRYYGIIR